jgi:hypothetical protein
VNAGAAQCLMEVIGAPSRTGIYLSPNKVQHVHWLALQGLDRVQNR